MSLRLLYHATAGPSVRIVHARAAWWFTGKIAEAWEIGADRGIAVALYERDSGTELPERRAWFTYGRGEPVRFVCNEFEHN